MNDLCADYLAGELLSRQSRIGTGLWVRELDFGRRMLFDTFEHYRSICGGDEETSPEGCTVRCEGVDLILYSHGWDIPRINYTLAHEAGHILLGHAGADPEAEEREANRFASALIVPHAPLRMLGRVSAREVAKRFGCSVSAASAAMRRPCVVTEFDQRIVELFRDRLRKRNPLDISFDL